MKGIFDFASKLHHENVLSCPIDPYVFPELDKLRSGDSLEARFNAFKIPESNFLVFEATVRTCRDGCQPAYCPGQSGRSEPSFGRRRRSINGTLVVESTEELADTVLENENSTMTVNGTGWLIRPAGKAKTSNFIFNLSSVAAEDKRIFDPDTSPDIPEHVREMIEVFETRDEIDNDIVPRKLVSPLSSICLTPSEYHGLISAVVLLMILLLSITLAAGLAYRFDDLVHLITTFDNFKISFPQTILVRHDKESFLGPQFASKFIYSVSSTPKYERFQSSI